MSLAKYQAVRESPAYSDKMKRKEKALLPNKFGRNNG